MNTLQSGACNELVLRALSAATSKLVPAGSSCWQFVPRNGEPHLITAKTDGCWLGLEADHPGDAQGPESFRDALARSGSLSGLAKIALADDGRLRLRAEIPVQEDSDLATRILEACAAFVSVWSPAASHATGDAPREGALGIPGLKQLCAAAGWPCSERGDGRVAVELEAPHGFYRGVLAPLRGGVAVTCELATIDEVAEDSQQAIAGLLLASSGAVRMARGALGPDPTRPVAQLEAVFGTAPSPSEISSALESLSVGCSLCGEEVKTLLAPAVAQRYLALRGWDSKALGRQNQRTLTP